MFHSIYKNSTLQEPEPGDIVYLFRLQELYTPGMYADSVYMMVQVSM